MPQAKRASKGKRPRKAVSVLGIAGASLAASTSGPVADMPVADIPSQSTAPFQFLSLGDEEISDVSLATFHLFDKEELATLRGGIQLARGGCGCGGHGGCGGCGHGGFGGCGHGGFGGCGRGCGFGRGCGRGCGYGGCGWGWWGGCGGCYWGWGWGGCCLSWGGCAWC
jgi:hypothetical protein